VPFGTGAFMHTEAEARALAESMIEVASGVGVPMVALISDLTEVLGDSVGNAPQLREIVRFLTGAYRETRLLETVLALAVEILRMGGLAGSDAEARQRAMQRLEDGEAARRFARMVAAFGGPADFLDRPDAYLPTAPVVAPVFPDRAGFVAGMDCLRIGLAMVALGAGRTRPDDSIDDAVGLAGMARVGTAVGPQRPLAVLHARDQSGWDHAAAALRGAVRIADAAPPDRPVIVGRLSG